VRHTAIVSVRAHGAFLAAEVGELAGVSGTTVGQWARRGYIQASVSRELPHVYSVEDVAEAAIVAALLRRGVRHADVRKAIGQLRRFGSWPLSEAPLATTVEGGKPRIILHEREGTAVLTNRGWQRLAAPPAYEDVRLRLRRSA
jgi:DNA-binding transcriptional MerR regulator